MLFTYFRAQVRYLPTWLEPYLGTIGLKVVIQIAGGPEFGPGLSSNFDLLLSQLRARFVAEDELDSTWSTRSRQDDLGRSRELPGKRLPTGGSHPAEYGPHDTVISHASKSPELRSLCERL